MSYNKYFKNTIPNSSMYVQEQQRDLADNQQERNLFTPQNEINSYWDRNINTGFDEGYRSDTRANAQTTAQKWGNAWGKMATLAGTTFLDSTIGTIWGLGESLFDLDPTRLWDNAFSNAMQDINAASEKAMPHYQTRKEQDTAWYKRMLTPGMAANFWGDTVFKNFGFTLGALGGGMLFGSGVGSAMTSMKSGKIAGAIGKAVAQGGDDLAKVLGKYGASSVDELIALSAKNPKIGAEILKEIEQGSKIIKNISRTQFVTGLAGSSVGEARIEAINGSEQYYNELVQKGMNPAEAKKLATHSGNVQFALNNVLLMASNGFQFGRLFKSGFVDDVLSHELINGSFTEAGEFAVKKGLAVRALGAGFSNAFVESGEEMSQAFVEEFSHDVINRRNDKEAQGAIWDILDSSVVAANNSFGNVDRWEEGFAGFITGLVGMPGVGKLTGKSDSWVEGGLLGELSNYKKAGKEAQEYVEVLNKIKNSESFKNNYNRAVEYLSYEQDKNEALKNASEPSYVSLDKGQLINDAYNIAKTGKLDSYIKSLEELKGMEGSELREMSKITKDKDGQLLETPVDVFKDKTDDEIKQINSNKINNLVETVNKVRDTRNNVNLKLAPLNLENKEDVVKALTYYSTMVDEMSQEVDKITERFQKELESDLKNKDWELKRFGYLKNISKDNPIFQANVFSQYSIEELTKLADFSEIIPENIKNIKDVNERSKAYSEWKEANKDAIRDQLVSNWDKLIKSKLAISEEEFKRISDKKDKKEKLSKEEIAITQVYKAMSKSIVEFNKIYNKHYDDITELQLSKQLFTSAYVNAYSNPEKIDKEISKDEEKIEDETKRLQEEELNKQFNLDKEKLSGKELEDKYKNHPKFKKEIDEIKEKEAKEQLEKDKLDINDLDFTFDRKSDKKDIIKLQEQIVKLENYFKDKLEALESILKEYKVSNLNELVAKLFNDSNLAKKFKERITKQTEPVEFIPSEEASENLETDQVIPSEKIEKKEYPNASQYMEYAMYKIYFENGKPEYVKIFGIRKYQNKKIKLSELEKKEFANFNINTKLNTDKMQNLKNKEGLLVESDMYEKIDEKNLTGHKIGDTVTFGMTNDDIAYNKKANPDAKNLALTMFVNGKPVGRLSINTNEHKNLEVLRQKIYEDYKKGKTSFDYKTKVKDIFPGQYVNLSQRNKLDSVFSNTDDILLGYSMKDENGKIILVIPNNIKGVKVEFDSASKPGFIYTIVQNPYTGKYVPYRLYTNTLENPALVQLKEQVIDLIANIDSANQKVTNKKIKEIVEVITIDKNNKKKSIPDIDGNFHSDKNTLFINNGPLEADFLQAQLNNKKGISNNEIRARLFFKFIGLDKALAKVEVNNPSTGKISKLNTPDYNKQIISEGRIVTDLSPGQQFHSPKFLMDLDNIQFEETAQAQPTQSTEQVVTPTQSEIEAKKADIEIGKVGNTEYEVKVDGVYYQGKKLDNPDNKTHKQLIEADIERRRQEDLPIINVYWGSAETPTNTRLLSNLAPRKFTYKGKEYGSVEHAYQSLKSGEFDQTTYDKYVAVGGYGTKIRGKQVNKGFDNLQLMKDLVVESFKQNPEQAKLLLKYKDFTHNTNEIIDKAFLEGLRLAKYDAELKALGQQPISTTQSESNPALRDVESTAKALDAKKADIERRRQEELKTNNLAGDLRSIISQRLIKEGISQEERNKLIGTSTEPIITSAQKQDIDNLLKSYEQNKEKQLKEFDAQGEIFNPETGNFVNNDTSFWDNKIDILNKINAKYDAELKALGQQPISTTQSDIETLEQSTSTTQNTEVKSNTIQYTPIGKERQTYTIEGEKILNSKGQEVFKDDTKDRRKILANFEVQNGNAIVVKANDNNNYVVNKNGKILSIKTGNIVFEDPTHGVRKELLEKASKKLNIETKSEEKVETKKPTVTKGGRKAPGLKDNINKPKLPSNVKPFEKWNEKDEIAWFKKNFPNYPIHVLDTLRNVRNNGGIEAWGLFTEAAVFMNKNAQKGTTFHEAFHLIFNLGLNQKQREDIINEYKNKYPSLKDKTNDEIEEEIADDFMDYMLSEDTSLKGKVKNFFRKIWEAIKAAFTDKVTIDELFFRGSQGAFKKLAPVKNTAYNKFKSDSLFNMPGLESFTEVQQRLQLINNGYFNLALKRRLEANKFMTIAEGINGLIRAKDFDSTIYYNIYLELENTFMDYNEDTGEHEVKSEYQHVEKQVNALLTNFVTFDENGNPIPGKLYKLAIRDLENIYNISFEFEDAIDDSDKESWQVKEFSTSRLDKVSDELKLFFSSIEKQVYNKNGEVETLYDTTFGKPFELYENPEDVKRFLLSKLYDTYNTTHMMEKLDELKAQHPFVNKIIELLNSNKNIKTQLWGMVASEHPLFEVAVFDKGYSDIFNANRNNLEATLRKSLKSSFLNVRPENSLIKEVDGKYVFDIEKINKYIAEIKGIKEEDYEKRVSDLIDVLGFNIDPKLKEYLNTDSEIREGNKKVTTTSKVKYRNFLGLDNKPGLLQFLENLKEYSEKGKNYTPFDIENSSVNNLVEIYSEIAPEIYQSAFRDNEGNQINNHIRTSYFGRLINKIKNEKFPFDEYQKDPAFENNMFVGKSGLFTNPNEARNVRFRIPYELREGFDSTAYTDYSDLQYEKVAFLQFYKGHEKGWANYILPVLETAPAQIALRSKVLGLDEVDLVKVDGKNVVDDSKMIDVFVDEFYKIALMEKATYENINLFKETIGSENKSLKVDNSFKTNYFLDKNNKPLFTYTEIDENPNKVKDKIKTWINNVFEYEKAKLEEIKFFEEMENESGIKTDDVTLKQYIFNSMITRTHINQITTGNLNFYKNTEDFFKRAKEIWSPGTHLDTEREDVAENTHYIFLEDETVKAEYLDALNSYYKKIKVPTLTRLKILATYGYGYNEKSIEGYNIVDNKIQFKNDNGKIESIEIKEVDITDAQGFITPSRWLEQQNGLGRVNEKIQETYNAIVSGKESAFREVMQTRKPFVYFQRIIKLTGEKNIILPTQIKNSEMVLLPQVIKGNKKLEALLAHLEKMEADAIKAGTNEKATAVFNSAVKVGLFGYGKIEQNGDSFKVSDNTLVHKISNDAWRLQMETPEHHLDNPSNKLGSQFWKIININNEIKEYLNLFNNLMNSKINMNYKKVVDKLSDNNKIKNELLSEGMKRGMIYSMLNLMDKIDNKDEKSLFRAGINPYITQKLQNLINSIYKNTVTNMKFPGGSYFNTSSLGFDDLEVKFKENGELDHFEVYLPSWMEGMTFGKMSEKAKTGIVYRIPTEGKYSMFSIKVKGFLPAEAGGNIIMPHGITTIAGLDFDIDKVYAMFYTLEKDKDGNYSPVEYLDETNSTLEERYEKVRKEVLKSSSEFIKINKEYYEKIKSQKEKINRSWVNQTTRIKNLISKSDLKKSEIIELKELRDEKKYQIKWITAEYNESKLLLDSFIKGAEENFDETILSYQIFGFGNDPMYIEMTLQEEVNKLELEIESTQIELENIFDKLNEKYNENIDVSKQIDSRKLRNQELLDEKNKLYEKRNEEISKIKIDLTIEEFSNLSIEEQNTEAAVNNKILDVSRELLSQFTNEVFKPGGFENLKRNANEIENLYQSGDKWMLPTSPSTFRETYRNMMDGSKLIGIAAIHNKSHSLFQVGKQNGIDMEFTSTPIFFFDDKEITIDGNKYKVEGDFNYGDKRKYIKNGKTIERNLWVSEVANYTSKIGKTYDINGNLINENFAEFLAAVVDNGKDPLASKFNFNLETADVGLTLIHMGYDLETVQYFLAQPIIKRMVNKIKNFKLNTDESIFDLNKEFNNELVEFTKKLPNQEKNAKAAELEDRRIQLANKILNSTTSYNYLSINSSKLKSSIEKYANKKVDEQYFFEQLMILETYKKLKNTEAKDIGDLIKVINTADNGAGPTVADNLLRHDIEDRVRESSSITNADLFISSSNLPINNLREKGVNAATSFFEDRIKLPYNNSSFRYVRKLMKESRNGSSLTAKDVDKMNINFISALTTGYVKSSKTMVNTFPKEFELRRKQEIKKAEKGQENFFELLNAFEIDTVSKKEPFKRILLKNSNGMNDRQQEALNNQFEALYLADKGFAQKIIDYSFHTLGFEYTHASFGHILPIDVISDDLVDYLEKQLEIMNEAQAANFFEQYVRNHYRGLKFIPVVKDTDITSNNENGILEIKKELKGKYQVSKNGSKEFPTFIKFYDSSKKAKLFKLINDEGIYNEIERLGVNNAVIEYNLDESNPQSVIIQEEDKVKNTTNVEKYLEAKEPEMQVKNTFDIFGTKTPKQQSTESVNKKLSLFDEDMKNKKNDETGDTTINPCAQ